MRIVLIRWLACTGHPLSDKHKPLSVPDNQSGRQEGTGDLSLLLQSLLQVTTSLKHHSLKCPTMAVVLMAA